jgi:hypothetical protein
LARTLSAKLRIASAGRGSWPAVAVPSIALAGAILLGCSGTGDGGTGDPASSPHPDKLGNGALLSEVLGPATWLNEDDQFSDNCAPPLDHNVHVTGLTIVAIDKFDETGKGANGNYYVQDTVVDPPAFSGITVFAPSFSPPDLRLAPGDVTDASGILQEFLGPSVGRFGYCKTLPEIGGTMTFRFEAGPLTPKTIPIEDLKSYPTARQWLGMLIRIESVRVANPPTNSSGRYTADLDVGGGITQVNVPKISNELYDIEAEGPPLNQGMTFSALSGVLTYFYGFKITPRSPDDFEP